MSHFTRLKQFIFVLLVINALLLIKLHSYFSDHERTLVRAQDFFKEPTKNQVILHSECSCRKAKLFLEQLNSSHFSVSSRPFDDQRWASLFYKTDTGLEYKVSVDELYRTNCNLYNTLRHGRSQKVIGLSLYGIYKRYYYHLERLSRYVKEMYPGWIIRVYHDNTIIEKIKCQLECLNSTTDGSPIDNVEFCNVASIPDEVSLASLKVNISLPVVIDASRTVNGMMWRWLPIGDQLVDVFMSRDADSLILQREIDSVNVWLGSNKTGHIMRDNFMHIFEMLGGMWGFYNSRDRRLAEVIYQKILDKKINAELAKERKDRDQTFLKKHVYQLLKKSVIIHDSYCCNRFNDSVGFPTQRQGNCYIGSIARNLECLKEEPHMVCPKQCRHQKDWLFC